MGSCRVENTETKEENCRLDYPALSCNDVSAQFSSNGEISFGEVVAFRRAVWLLVKRPKKHVLL